jgi:hypothetical protein
MFKTTNPLLPSNTRKEIEILYGKINGTSHITNNELMVWFVKGWIVEWNGHSINWAKVVVATTKEKAQCLSISIMNKPKMEKSSTNVIESSQQSQEGIGLGFTIVKLEKDASFF